MSREPTPPTDAGLPPEQASELAHSMGVARTWAVGIALSVLLVAISIVFAYAHLTTTTPIGAASPERLMAGTAATPFQYRVLVPFLLARAMGLVPAFAGSLGPLLLGTEAMFLLASSGVAALYFRGRGASPLAALALALAIALLPFCHFVVSPYRAYYFPSDVAGCFFLLSCLVAASRGRWGWFAVLFVIGTFNRETTVLALASAFLSRSTASGSVGRRTLLGCLLAYVAIKVGLHGAYAENPGAGLFELAHRGALGEPVGSHLATNLSALAAFPKVCFIGAFALGPIAVAMLGRDQIRDATFASYCRVAAFYSLALFGIGNLDELRVFGELIPPLAVAFLGSIGRRG